MAWAPAVITGASMLYDMYNKNNQQDNWQSTYSPEQQKLIQQSTQGMLGQGMPDISQNPMYQQSNDWLMSMFNDPDFFKSFEAPIMRDFQENTLPELTNRFGAMGSGGNFQSSAFRNQIGREGSNLHEKIAALRGMMQQGAIPQMLQSANMPYNNYQQMLQTVLGNQPNNVYQPPNNPMANLAGPALQYSLQNNSNNNTGNNNAGGGANNYNASPLGTYKPPLTTSQMVQ